MNQEAEYYWEQRAVKFAGEGRGLRAVCSFGMPDFYNNAIHTTQNRAMQHVLGDLSGQHVLDVGCGVGRWSIEMAAQADHVVGLDLSPTMLEQARQTAGERGVVCDFLQGSIASTRLDQQFDTIVCVTVLQHLRADELDDALANLAAMLKPGGRMVIMEVAPAQPESACNTPVFQSRTVEWYRDGFARQNMQVTAEYGVDVVPVKQKFLPLYPRLPAAVRNIALYLLCMPAMLVDLLVARFYPDASWHRVMVVQSANAADPQK